jgi:uncharacterized membrane protein YhaH (DUF805 family)
MRIVHATYSALANSLDFQGRAGRWEFWSWTLFCIALEILTSMSPHVHLAFEIAAVVPGVSLGVRRLHDIGKGGRWVLLALVPIVGGLIFLWWALRPSDGPNDYGDAPRNVESSSPAALIIGSIVLVFAFAALIGKYTLATAIFSTGMALSGLGILFVLISLLGKAFRSLDALRGDDDSPAPLGPPTSTS